MRTIPRKEVEHGDGQRFGEQPQNKDIYGGKRNVFVFQKGGSDQQLLRACGREFQIVAAA